MLTAVATALDMLERSPGLAEHIYDTVAAAPPIEVDIYMQHQLGFMAEHLSTPLPSPVQSVPIITLGVTEELEAAWELDVATELEAAAELEEATVEDDEATTELELLVAF